MRKVLVLLTLLIFSGMFAMAQKTVTGKVTDEKGVPVSGASVKIRGTNTGTTTNSDGTFSLDISKAGNNPSLEISGVGLTLKTVRVSAGQTVNVALESETKNMSEIVITGVGTATSKRKVAIDVSTVNSKDFAKSGTGSIEQNIMGQIAGAQIQQTSGQPNQGFNIILRGINTLQGSQPMILYDGVEVNDLSDIDPSTVDRVEVVKGAAAGFLYGAQGANGVIQIFSKKGTKGKMNITLSSKINFDRVLRNKDVIASMHHYLTDAQGFILDNVGNRVKPNAVGQWPDPILDQTLDSKNDKPFMEPTYDHISQSFKQAITYNNSVSITGGSDKADYAFTTSYLDQQDVYSNKFRRLNLDLNLGLELFKGFTLRSNTQTIFSEDNLLTNANNRFGMVNSFAYIDFTSRDSLGNLIIKNRNENQHNPLSEAEWHQTSTKPFTLLQNIGATYKFPRFVTLDYKFGLEKTIVDGFDYYKNQTQSLQGAVLPWGNNVTGSIFKYKDTHVLMNSLASIFINTDFQKDFNSKLPIKTTTQVSYDWRKDTRFFFGTEGIGLPTYPPVNIAVAQTSFGSDNPKTFFGPNAFTPGTFVTFGILANQSLDYGNLFGINGGVRSDYSSEFGAGSTPFTFFRGAAYFRPSDLIKSSMLTDWKIRGAIGKAGTQPDRYSRQVTLDVATLGSNVALFLPFGGSNPNLRVQLSREFELGTDVTLNKSNAKWLNRFTFSGTYWNRLSSDVIQKADVAPSTGYGSTTDNLTTFRSKGVDLNLDVNVLNDRNVTWTFAYRMGFAKTTVVKIANNADVVVQPFSLKVGQEVGALYGQYVIKDINQTRPDGSLYIAVADQKFYTTVDGNIVDTRTNKPLISDANDLKSFGSVYPKFNAAFINTFTIKNNLTVSFQFDWYSGNMIYNQSRQWLYRDQISKDYDNSVTIGTKTGAFVNYYNGFYNSVSPDSYFAENGSFLRLRNASITYDFAKHLHLKWVKSAELTLAGRNLWTISGYKGLDPENTSSVDSQGNDVSQSTGGFKGVDYFGVPNTKSYQIGLVLGF